METVLVLTYTETDGSLAKHALEVLAAAKAIKGTLVVGLIGENVQAAANRIAGCGAARFLGATGKDFAQARYGSDAAAAEAICRAAKATIVIALATSRWNRILAGVAHRLGGRADMHVTDIDAADAIVVTRWYYRQRMEAAFQRTQRPWVIALEAGCAQPWKGDAGT
ncbi:MAG TPA: electron transfer flavoprotein subunit alpha, partial [Verrucomicrobiae bacterium]|nr:electron transfer flavoprotein subunit alpha [Verrucomicrobiae bacterium]